MPIQGNIEEAGLPDVLQLLSLGRKSGCLTLVDGETQGQIYLDVGRISYATVASRLDRLGDMLVKSGRITQQQLSTAVDEQRRSGKRQLGRILVDSGQIDRAELERYIRLQVENAVYYLFTWKQGTFSFASDRLPPHQPLLVSLDAESLLLEGARRVDEWSLIEKKIPSFDLVYRNTRDKLGSSADGLTEEQKTILPLLDGSRDVAAIIDFTAMSEFEVGKAIYGLLTAGFVQLVERRAHIRHLEYRDLLAYVVREAEFSDAQRRKEAARHIVDCPTCAERLRTIHVRRSTGSGMVPVDLPDEALGALAAPVAAPSRAAPSAGATLVRQPALARPRAAPDVRHPAPLPPAAELFDEPLPVRLEAAAPPPERRRQAAPSVPQRSASPAEFVERRGNERRTGRDRRAFDRRTGIDRRHEVGMAALQPSVERRRGPRRDDDRRGGPVRERRATDARQRSAAPEAIERTTERRQSIEQQVEAAFDFEPSERPSVETTPVAEQVMAFTPPAPPPVADVPPMTAAATPAQPGVEPDGADLEWLVSPRESLEMIRASQAQLRAMAAASGAQSKAGAVPPAKHVPDRRAGAAASVRGAATAPRGETRRLERFRAGANGEHTAGGAKTAGSTAQRSTFPLRSLAVAAGLACVALLGYLAGQLGRKSNPGPVGESTEASALAPTAAQAQAARAHGNETRNRARAEEPPPQQAPAAAQPAPARPASEPRPDARTRARAAPAVPVATAAPTPAQSVAPPAPTVGVIRGVVRDASGAGVAGARVSVGGTALAAVADGSGAFEIRDVPDGQVALQASADGFVAGGAQVRSTAGTTVAANLTLERVRPAPPAAPAVATTATEPDQELAAGGWAAVDRSEAATLLGGTLGSIQGLGIESISKATAGTRTRIRVAQLTATGERIVLTETRAGAAVRGGSGPAIVTALRVMPASEAYPWCTGTASLGNILVTVKTKLSADVVRPLLQRLGEVPGQ